jgi:phage/plasmid primase-like uncharacterized protein
MKQRRAAIEERNLRERREIEREAELSFEKLKQERKELERWEDGRGDVLDPKNELGKNPEKAAGPIIIAVGRSAAESLQEATGCPVACVLHADNLKPVARVLHERYPEAKLVIAADDDRARGRTVGPEKARHAARLVGGSILTPGFTETELAKGMTNFNDLARSRGKEAVRELLAPMLGLERKRERTSEIQRDEGRSQTVSQLKDTTLEIREAEQILQERAEAREKEHERERQEAEKVSRGRSRERECDSGMEM